MWKKWMIGLGISGLILLGPGCRNDSNHMKGQRSVSAELQPLYDDVMKIHDDVMPEMQQISMLQGQLSARLDTLRSQQSVDRAMVKETNKILGGLNRAENAMWTWMHDFAKIDSIPAEEVERFLMREKSSALSMKELVLQSILDAKEYFLNNDLSAGHDG